MPNPIDVLIADLTVFQTLGKGWDGEDAEKPNPSAIRQAIRFVRAAGDLPLSPGPSLHVDGSVILDFDEGAEGLLRFPGDDTIVYVSGAAFGRIAFDGKNIPEDLKPILTDWRAKSKRG